VTYSTDPSQESQLVEYSDLILKCRLARASFRWKHVPRYGRETELPPDYLTLTPTQNRIPTLPKLPTKTARNFSAMVPVL